MYSKQELSNIIKEYLLSGADINAGKITGDEIIENMSGYAFHKGSLTGWTLDFDYVGVCKNGNKITFALAFAMTKGENPVSYGGLGDFNIPSSVGEKLFPSGVDSLMISAFYINGYYTANVEGPVQIRGKVRKNSNTNIDLFLTAGLGALTANTKYYFRLEITYLLSENLVSE